MHSQPLNPLPPLQGGAEGSREQLTFPLTRKEGHLVGVLNCIFIPFSTHCDPGSPPPTSPRKT